MKKLSHVTRRGRPAMVNVGGKAVTHRVARAEAVVVLPPAVRSLLRKGELRTKKGPVFQAAILAGIMAAKRTSELVPLCHPLPLDGCDVRVRAGARGRIEIECRVETHHRTGVEMEALTGAAVAALTIYDMCKSLSHDIVIGGIRLIEKRGGRHDFRRH